MRPSEKGIIVVKDNRIKGNLLDIGGSVKIKGGEKPIDFKKVREKVKKQVARKVAQRGLREIYSYDKDFETIEDIERKEP